MISKQKGFSLVEVFIVTVIISIIAASLFLAFQTGIHAHSRNEQFLGDDHVRELFVMQIARELRNAIPFSLEPFKGDVRGIRFPTRLRHYSKKGFQEGLYAVEYKFSQNRLIRTERPLKRESLRESRRVDEEILFDHLKTFRVEYLYMTKDGDMKWETEWKDRQSSVLPRGVRLKITGDVFGEPGMVRDILIPQGVLLVSGS